jgi:hypothetical protein
MANALSVALRWRLYVPPAEGATVHAGATELAAGGAGSACPLTV